MTGHLGCKLLAEYADILLPPEVADGLLALNVQLGPSDRYSFVFLAHIE
jgi:hypothetical protein